MVTKGMFWKRFYFVVILLSCNCFLLCSDGFCEPVKRFFGYGRQEEINTQYSDYGEGGNLKNNINNNNYIGDTIENENNKNQDDKNEIDLSGYSPNRSNIISNLKCIFMSDIVGVGKTSIINCLCGKEFDNRYFGTAVCAYFAKKYKVLNRKEKISIHLWDYSGNKKYIQMVPFYIRDANAIVFVYDITNNDSFCNLCDYIAEVKTEVKKLAPEGCLFFLLGNKFDLADTERQVTREDAKKFAEDKDLIFLGECSAKNNTYIPDENTCYKEGELEEGKCPDCVTGIFKDILYNIVNKQRSQGE